MIISELRVFASSIPMHFLQNNSNFGTFGLRHSTPPPPPPPLESFSVYVEYLSVLVRGSSCRNIKVISLTLSSSLFKKKKNIFIGARDFGYKPLSIANTYKELKDLVLPKTLVYTYRYMFLFLSF